MACLLKRGEQQSDQGMAEHNATSPGVPLRVELFGRARLVCGQSSVDITVPADVTISEIVTALATVCPELRGTAIRADLSGLHESYICNLNGLTFITQERLHLQPGDTLLVFSSQAGG
jgi:hypothetical protein